ncbi:hypothetical protein V2I01_40915 [Micromonospora sp. BRA006-A]|nr:hypothetical protein [Micromonospora sp. BRA006-A]
MLYSVGGTAGSIVVGLAAALAVRGPFRGRTLVRASMLLPYVAPVVAMTFVWQVMLDPQLGIVNDRGAASSAGTSRCRSCPRSPPRCGR